MPLSPEDLQHIAARTLAYDEQHARSYWEGTRDHDVSQHRAHPCPNGANLLSNDLRTVECKPCMGTMCHVLTCHQP